MLPRNAAHYTRQAASLVDITLNHPLPPSCCQTKRVQADADMFAPCAGVPDKTKAPHAYRWYIHIAAIKGVRRCELLPLLLAVSIMYWSAPLLFLDVSLA